jgi:hypothetical protein
MTPSHYRRKTKIFSNILSNSDVFANNPMIATMNSVGVTLFSLESRFDSAQFRIAIKQNGSPRISNRANSTETKTRQAALFTPCRVLDLKIRLIAF